MRITIGTGKKPTLNVYVDIEAGTEAPKLKEDKCEGLLGYGVFALPEKQEEFEPIDTMECYLPHPTVWGEEQLRFWNETPKRRELLKKMRENAISQEKGFEKLRNFIVKHSRKYKLVWWAGPSAYDWMWIKIFYETFKGEKDPEIGFKAECVSTMKKTLAKLYPKAVDEIVKWADSKHLEKHNPLEDAKNEARIHHRLERLIILKNANLKEMKEKIENGIQLVKEITYYPEYLEPEEIPKNKNKVKKRMKFRSSFGHQGFDAESPFNSPIVDEGEFVPESFRKKLITQSENEVREKIKEQTMGLVMKDAEEHIHFEREKERMILQGQIPETDPIMFTME